MNLLFELYTAQCQIGGAAEYIRKIFYTLLDIKANRQNDINIIALVDSSIGKFSYSDLSPESLQEKGIIIADYKYYSFKNIISKYHIDRFFFGCAQYMGYKKDLMDLKIPGVIVVHDLCYEEYANSNINELPNLPYNWFLFNRLRIGSIKRRILGQWKNPLLSMNSIMTFANANNRVQLVTVSEYTRSTLVYNFSYPSDRIPVLYSCERCIPKVENIKDEILKKIVLSGKKYYLMLSANRKMKNPRNAFSAFKRYVESGHKDFFLVTTGCEEKQFENHIPLGYLSDGDLVQVMQNCYALLFPSFFEGFGYPPVEAMRFGKPVLSSNVTSMPEILGDAPIYFSPIYQSDIFRALCTLTEDNYMEYSKRSQSRYAVVNMRQKNDLKKLTGIILG